jgi:hypothetical protein
MRFISCSCPSTLEVNYVLGFLHNLDIGNIADVSEVFGPEYGGSVYLEMNGKIIYIQAMLGSQTELTSLINRRGNLKSVTLTNFIQLQLKICFRPSSVLKWRVLFTFRRGGSQQTAKWIC